MRRVGMSIPLVHSFNAGRIGYDLDGILAPDVRGGEGFNHVLDVRDELFVPLFKPQGEWCIITGRPAIDISTTKEWVKKNFVGQHHFKTICGVDNFNAF